MIQIRSNVFETNSSSAHSLVIQEGSYSYYTSDEVFNELQWLCKECEEDPGKYVLQPWHSEFDDGFNRWPFQVLTTFREKMWYLYAHAPVRHYPATGNRKYSRYQPEYYKVTNYLKKYLPWLKGIDWKYCNERYKKPSSEAYGFNGVLKTKCISWHEFLFNKNIIVICDGDEYGVWQTMKNCGLINEAGIKKELKYD